MDVSFSHDIKNNYMVIKVPYSTIGYKLKMIEKNEIHGILNTKYTVIDGLVYIKYNISSKITIKDMFSKEKIKSVQLKTILWGIIEVVENLEEYLLDINNIILKNNKIYLDIDKKIVYLCYNPIYKEDFFVAFKELAQKLLSLIDYNDLDAVEMIYMINEWCSKEENNLGKLKSLLSEMNIAQKISNEKIINQNPEDISKNTDTGQNSIEYNYSIPEKKKSIAFFFKLLKIKFVNLKNKMCADWDFYEKKEFQEDYSTSINNDNIMSTVNHNDTIVLSENLNQNRCLISLTKSDTIDITDYPFVIGRLENNVDGIIRHSSVSRIQAKLEYNKGKYFIEDLNSINGTYVNQQRLDPYEVLEIRVGDKIGFSDLEYVFR